MLGTARFNSHCYESIYCDGMSLEFLHRIGQIPKKTRAQYLASRLLAQEVMEIYGVRNFTLLNYSDRSPVWPRGISGSLSHDRDTIVLAATRRNLLVGIDVETFMDKCTAQEVAEIIVAKKEIEKIRNLPIPFRVAVTLAFSLKESLYKALWPRLQQEMDFCHVNLVDIDCENQYATLKLNYSFQKNFSHSSLFHARFSLGLNRAFTILLHPTCPIS